MGKGNKEINFFHVWRLLADLFEARETLNFSSLPSILEKIQEEANEIEDCLYDHHNIKKALIELRAGAITEISEFCNKIRMEEEELEQE